MKQESIFVHYIHLSENWDEWIHPQTQKTRLKPLDKSIYPTRFFLATYKYLELWFKTRNIHVL